jgi:hypothetical protein
MSSPATLLGVVCYGLQDTRLLPPKGQPEIKHYAKVLKKTTRWAAQMIRVDFDGQPDFGKKVTCSIPRKAELLTQVTLVVTMPDIYTAQQNARSTVPSGKCQGPTYGWTNSLGHAMIALVELDIGGVNVDTFDGRYLEIYDELYEPITSVKSKNRMIHRIDHIESATRVSDSPGRIKASRCPNPIACPARSRIPCKGRDQSSRNFNLSNHMTILICHIEIRSIGCDSIAPLIESGAQKIAICVSTLGIRSCKERNFPTQGQRAIGCAPTHCTGWNF